MTRVIRVSSCMKVNRDQKFYENRKGKGSKPVSGVLAALLGRVDAGPAGQGCGDACGAVPMSSESE